MSERTGGLPTLLSAWERALVDRFLRVGPGGDASPLRAFEITGDTLASAFPDVGATGKEAESAFQIAVRADPHVWAALRDGSHSIATGNRPNCFAYLCASLLIDTLLEGAYSDLGQYRERLRTWLGTSRSMMQLSGIAHMWRDLSRWLENKAAAGDDFRTLVLPDPRSWTQIGYTRRLSFPTRGDVRFLERVLANFTRGLSDRPGLIRAIEAAVLRGGASWGMEAAFGEFRDDFRSGGASSQHRFWRLVLRAAAAEKDGPVTAAARLEIEYDEDGCPGLRLDGAPIADLGSAMRTPPVMRSGNLGAAVQQGVVFFRQVGMARWSAESEPPIGQAHVGVAPTHAIIARGTTMEFQLSGDWLLTVRPVAQRLIDDLLRRLHLAPLRQERLIEFSLEGGVRIGVGFLGRPCFLPRVTAFDRTVAIRSLPAGGVTPPTAQWINGAVVAAEPLDGWYEFSVSAGSVNAAAEWTRRIRFHRDALPHLDLGGAAEREPPIAEWTALETNTCLATPTPRLEWNDHRGAVTDLLEAIYAAGRSSLGEPDLLDLIFRARPEVSVWDALRAIQEADFVMARRRSRWRGRVWTLVPPRLISLGKVTLVEGATCAKMQEEFRQVAQAAGGSPFRLTAQSAWSPPIIGAVDVEVSRLAEILGWAVCDAPVTPLFIAMSLETSPLIGEHYERRSSWDWESRRFVTRPIVEREVSITRWVHPGGRDHDQYRVRSPGGETRHATRIAAILQGHATFGEPLFGLEGGSLVRRAAEGALPLEIARWLRRWNAEGGGPLADGSYAYPLGNARIRDLAIALPGCIEGAVAETEPAPNLEPAGVSAVSVSRRSRGRIRLHWRNGEVRAA